MLAKLLPAAMIAAGISACSSSGSKDTSREHDFEGTEIEASGFVDSSQHGLELRLMTVDDTGNRVAQALGRFDRDLGVLSDTDRLRWRNWGLRWIAVPLNQLDTVLGSQVNTQAIQLLSMGEFPQWRPLIRTGEIRSGYVHVGTPDHEHLQQLEGRPRLLARVWTTPVVEDSGVRAGLHVDLAIQMNQIKTLNSWEKPVSILAIDEGQLIRELMISPILGGTHALVLVGEDPSVDWIVDTESGQDGQVVVQQAADRSLGPNVPGPRTLGEQMLSTPGTGTVAPGSRYVAPKKVLIVLVPTVREQYRLLGRSVPVQSSKANTP